MNDLSPMENQQLKPVRKPNPHDAELLLLPSLLPGHRLVVNHLQRVFSYVIGVLMCVCVCLRVCVCVCVCILFFEIYYRCIRKSLEQNSSNSQIFETFPCSKLLCPGFSYLGKRSHRVSINKKCGFSN